MSETSTQALLDEILKDKDLRLPVLKTLAKTHPDVYLPELNIEEKLSGMKQDVAQRMDALEKQVTDRDTEIRLSAEREALARKHNLDESGLKEVEKLMLDKGIVKYDSALEFRKLSATKPPESRAPLGFETPDDKSEYFLNRRGTAKKVARQVIEELRLQQE